MKSQRKRTREKKQRQADMADTMTGGSMADTLIISGSSDVTIDLGGYGAQPTYTLGDIDTITLDPSSWNSTTVTSSTLSWSQDYTVNTPWINDPNVNISAKGVEIKEGGDLKIGDRSMKEFMDKVEDQLAILRPAPELEEKWDKLKELRRQYEECKQDILEKEKIMKILKET
jgi:hypothetical protein